MTYSENIKTDALLPRELLLKKGSAALSDQELLSILLGSGNKERNVFLLAKEVEKVFDLHKLPEISVKDLSRIKGIGTAKATLIMAALEFTRRRIASDGVKIRSPEDVLPLITHLADRKQETFICVSLNGAHEVIASRIVTVGLVNLCQVHPREVFSEPLTDRACSVIVAHNHPSGELTPSKEDYLVTERLEKAAEILGIKFLDHIIFSKRGFLSLKTSKLNEQR